MKVTIARIRNEQLLLRKVEAPESEFIATDGDRSAPVYKVEHCDFPSPDATNAPPTALSYVLLKPRHYPAVEVDGQQFTVASFDDLLAEVEVEGE